MALAPTDGLQDQDPTLGMAQRIQERLANTATIRSIAPVTSAANSDSSLDLAQRIARRVKAPTIPITAPVTQPQLQTQSNQPDQPVTSTATPTPISIDPKLALDTTLSRPEQAFTSAFRGAGGFASHIAHWFHQDSAADQIKKYVEENFPTNPNLQDEFFSTKLPQFIGGASGIVAGGAIAAAAAPETAAGSIVGGILGALDFGGAERESARSNGVSEGKQLAAQAVGTGLGALFGRLASNGPVVRYLEGKFGSQLTQRVLSGALRSGGEAYTIQGASNIAAKTIGYDPNRSITQGLGEATLFGGITGAVHGGLAKPEAGLQNSNQPPEETPIQGIKTSPEGDIIPLAQPRQGSSMREEIPLEPGEVKQPSLFSRGPAQRTTMEEITGEHGQTGEPFTLQIPKEPGRVPTVAWEDLQQFFNPGEAARIADKRGVLIEGAPDEVVAGLDRFKRLEARRNRQQARSTQGVEPEPLTSQDQQPLITQHEFFDYQPQRQINDPPGPQETAPQPTQQEQPGQPTQPPSPILSDLNAPTPAVNHPPQEIFNTLRSDIESAKNKGEQAPADFAGVRLGNKFTPEELLTAHQELFEAPKKLMTEGKRDEAKAAMSAKGELGQSLSRAIATYGREYADRIGFKFSESELQQDMERAGISKPPTLTAADNGAGGNGKSNAPLPAQPTKSIEPAPPSQIDVLSELDNIGYDPNTLSLNFGGVAGNAARLSSWGTGELLEQAAKGLVGEGEGLGRLTRAAKISSYSQPLQDIVGSQAGAIGEGIKTLARAADRLAVKLLGRIEETGLRARNQVKSWGGSNPLRKELLNHEQHPLDPNAFISTAMGWIEGTSQKVMSTAAQNWVQMVRRLTDNFGRSIEQLGTIKRNNGEPFYRTTDGKVMFRLPRNELQGIIHNGGRLYEHLLQTLNNVNPGMSLDELRGITGEIISGQTKPNRILENLRKIEVFPDRIFDPVDKEFYQLLETDPYTYLKRAFTSVADRAAFIHSFSQSKQDIQQIRENFMKAGGNINDLDNLLKAMNHIPLDPGQLPNPNSNVVTDILGGSLSVFKSLALSAAAIKNVPQTLIWGPTLGWGRYIEGMTRVLANTKANSVELRAIGALHGSIADFSLHLDSNNYIRSGAHNIGQVISIMDGFKLINDFNDRAMGAMGLVMRDDLIAGKGEATDFNTLRIMGFTLAESRSLINRTASRELYNEVPRKAISTQFSNLRPSEHAPLALSPRFKQLFAFQSYAQGTIKLWSNAFRQLGEAFKTGDAKEITNGTRVFSRAVFGSALAGAASLYLSGLFFGRRNGPKNWNDANEVEGFAARAFMESMMSGPMATLYHANPNQDPMALLGGISYPISIGANMYRAVARQGRFADKQTADVAIEFLKSMAPVLNGPFGIYGTGLTADQRAYYVMVGMRDPEIDTAMKSYGDWARKNIPGSGRDTSQMTGWDDFSSQMKQAYGDARNGRLNDAYDKMLRAGIVAQIREATGVKGAGSRGVKSVIASLTARQVLSKLTSEQKINLMQTVGGEAYQKLIQHDFLLQNLSQHYAAMIGENASNEPNVFP